MLDIETVEREGVELVDSRILHKALEVRSYHADWIRRRIENYQFEEGMDYYVCLSKKSSKKGSGGSNRKDYLITKDMSKELAMLENNDIGKKVRKYFIQKEKEANQYRDIRSITKHTRKTLTDKLQESGEDNRMHGHGYSTYTKLIYSLTDLTFRYREYSRHSKTGFRDSLTGDDLKRVELAESLIKPLLEMDKQYSEIKDTLKPLFQEKIK